MYTEGDLSCPLIKKENFQIAIVNSEIEQLVTRRLATSGPQEDKLAPFRQQAAVIRRNKEASATRVHGLTASLKEHEANLTDLQSQVLSLQTINTHWISFAWKRKR